MKVDFVSCVLGINHLTYLHLPCRIVEWAVRQIENQINEMLKFGHEIKSGYDVIEIIRIICENLFNIF